MPVTITIASIMNLMGPDMMVILLIVLLLFGAKKLPELARGMGRAVKEFGAARYRRNSMIARVTRRPRKKRIVILGGGFGGVYVAVYLEKLFSSRELKDIEIVLVNR